MPKVTALNCIKWVPVGAVVKAHPVVFGVCLALALGIVVYKLAKPKKQKKHKYSSGRGGDDDPTDHSGGGNDGPDVHSGDMLFYDPETKSLTDSVPLPKISNNDIRKRHVARNSLSTSNKNQQQNSAAPQNKNVSVSKEVQTESVDHNQNIDDRKVLPDKNLDYEMSVDEKVNDFLHRNIHEPDSPDRSDESDSTNDLKPSEKCCDCESHSSENPNRSSSSDSISSEPIKKCCCNFKSHSLGNYHASSSDSVSSSWSCVSPSEVNNVNKTSRAPSICSVTSIDSASSLGTVLSGDSELCRGCEQNPVNTHTQPCNHRYMCSDCAMRIFRLFKRCKVCRTRIERIVVEE